MPVLEDLYREIILDHYRTPRNRGELPTPPATVATGHNPLCGDEITIYLQIEDARVTDVKVGGQGCSISQSSASMMSQAIIGKSLDEVRALVRRFKSMMSLDVDDEAGDESIDEGDASPVSEETAAPLGDRATLDELRRWRRQLGRDGLPCGPDDWMFCNTTGRFLNPESVSQLFDRIVQRSGLPRVRFHDLRHTHASLLVADGTAIKVVSERLGHAHPAFTMHTYQHLSLIHI